MWEVIGTAFITTLIVNTVLKIIKNVTKCYECENFKEKIDGKPRHPQPKPGLK